MNCRCECECPRNIDFMQDARGGKCYACCQDIHPSQELKRQIREKQEKSDAEKLISGILGHVIKIVEVNNEFGRLGNEARRLGKPEADRTEAEHEFVFIGKVKTCGRHGITCEEL